MKKGEQINLKLPTLEELTYWLSLDLEHHSWDKEKYDNIKKNELVFRNLINGNLYCYNKEGHGFLIPLCCLVNENIYNDYLEDTTRNISI